MGQKYSKAESGEPVDIPWRDGGYMYLACCDCGLVHKITVAATKRMARLRFYRDERRTGQIRRYRKIKIKEENDG